jgi:hypothetical protein
VIIKALLLLIPQVRAVILLPYFMSTSSWGGGVVIPPNASMPWFLPFPINFQAFLGIFFTLIFFIFYLFYLNPVRLFYNYEEKKFKSAAILFIGISVVLSLLLHMTFNNFTITFFAFFALLSLNSFYDTLEKDRSKATFWKVIGVIIAIILVMFIFDKTVVDTGAFREVTDPILDRFGIEGGADSISDFWNMIIHPERFRDYGSVEDEDLKKKDIGIEIDNLGPVSQTFNPGQPIGVRGTVKAASLYSEDSEVSFNCEMEDYDGDPSLNPESVTLKGNAVKLTQIVSCIFDEGIVPKTRLESKSVSFISTFEKFYTESTYDIFILDSNRYDELYSEGENPFNVYGWDKSLVGPGNIMNSKVSPGPVDLIIGSEISQPFREEENDLFFEVVIKPDTRVNVKKIEKEDFRLLVPRGIVSLKEGDHCDFESSTSEVNNYDLYTIKKDLNVGTDDVFLGCFFDINDFLDEGEYRQDRIRAEMIYSFDITKKTSVSVRQN